jgi:Mg-chelatase subunit ChlD
MENANPTDKTLLEIHKGDNFIFAIDVSASMQTRDCPGNTSRIEYLKEQVVTFATEASKWDSDGIDVLTFGQQVTHYDGIDAEKAAKVIRGLRASEGMTDTAAVITAAYNMHKKGGYAQTILFLATDGAPSNQDAVVQVIRDIANKLADRSEFSIEILTVGVIDTGLRSFLDMIDEHLNAKHDIVAVKELTSVDFMAAFVGALND